MIDQVKGSYPANNIGKTVKDQRIIRPVDLNKVIDEINAEFTSTSKPYKELIYSLDADNSGSNPTGVEGLNDYSSAPTFANIGTGSYTMTLAGAFAGIVTHCDISIFPYSVSSEVDAYIVRANDNTVLISITDAAGAAIDGFQGTIRIITIPNV